MKANLVKINRPVSIALWITNTLLVTAVVAKVNGMWEPMVRHFFPRSHAPTLRIKVADHQPVLVGPQFVLVFRPGATPGQPNQAYLARYALRFEDHPNQPQRGFVVYSSDLSYGPLQSKKWGGEENEKPSTKLEFAGDLSTPELQSSFQESLANFGLINNEYRGGRVDFYGFDHVMGVEGEYADVLAAVVVF